MTMARATHFVSVYSMRGSTPKTLLTEPHPVFTQAKQTLNGIGPFLSGLDTHLVLKRTP